MIGQASLIAPHALSTFATLPDSTTVIALEYLSIVAPVLSLDFIYSPIGHVLLTVYTSKEAFCTLHTSTRERTKPQYERLDITDHAA